MFHWQHFHLNGDPSKISQAPALSEDYSFAFPSPFQPIFLTTCNSTACALCSSHNSLRVIHRDRDRNAHLAHILGPILGFCALGHAPKKFSFGNQIRLGGGSNLLFS